MYMHLSLSLSLSLSNIVSVPNSASSIIWFLHDVHTYSSRNSSTWSNNVCEGNLFWRNYIEKYSLQFSALSSQSIVLRCIHLISKRFVNPVGWGCRIHRLHLSREVRLPQRVSWLWHWMIWWWGSSFKA